jgi:hypothetical protein
MNNVNTAAFGELRRSLMIGSVTQWFQSKSFGQQLIILTVVFDPLGFAGGYLLGSSIGLPPLFTGGLGLAAGGLPMALHVMYRSLQVDERSPSSDQ